MHGLYIKIICTSCFDHTQNQPSGNLIIYTKGNQSDFSLKLCLAPASLNAFNFPHFWTHALFQSKDYTWDTVTARAPLSVPREANIGTVFEEYAATVHRIPHSRKFWLTWFPRQTNEI